MNRLITLCCVCLMAIVFSVDVTAGSDGLTKDEVEKLLVGNTVEGFHTKWGDQMIWYFREDGKLKKLKSGKSKGKSNWTIDKKGQLCHQDKHMKDPKCFPVIRSGDDKYTANDGLWRFDKVLPGNPHNL